MSNLTFLKDNSLILPIPQSARQQAQSFRDLFEDVSTGNQVYLDTLALLVINNYLEMIGVETDLFNSESWDPFLRISADVSDLKLIDLGHLECRAVTPGATCCIIPQDAWENRIGYVIVEIQEENNQAQILGFIEKIRTPDVFLDHLQPIEALLRHLSQLRQPQVPAVSISLHRWFEQIFENGWQPLVEGLALGNNLQPSFRRHNLYSNEVIQGVKRYDLGKEGENISVFLVILVTFADNEQIGVLVQLHPIREQTHLPEHIQLSLLESTGKCLKKVKSGQLDNYIQLPYFEGSLGEHFQIQITFNQTSITQFFGF